MPVCKLYQTITQMSSHQRLLGLDIGKKTIGLAISDPGLQIASPLKILWRRKFTPDAQELIQTIQEHEIGGMILGWPVNMDGSQGPACDSVRDFAHAFLRLHDIAISFQDERLSTKAVEQEMIAADLTRQKRHLRRDALAATWILQSALDSLPAIKQLSESQDQAK